MATYIHGHDHTVLASHGTRTVANSAAYLLDDLRPGVSVLDVGCGPGSITADIAELVAPGRVVAIDSAAEAVTATQRLCAERGLSNVDATVGTVYELQADDATFDIVHAHQVLQHVDDPVAALEEMRRVCTSDGVVAARDGDYEAFTWYPQIPELDQWLDVYRRTARADGGEPDAGRRLIAWAHRAGFTDVAGSASTWCYTKGNGLEWWCESWSKRVTESAFAERSVAHGFATQADLNRIADAWRRLAHEPDGWFTILHGEIRCRPHRALSPRR